MTAFAHYDAWKTYDVEGEAAAEAADRLADEIHDWANAVSIHDVALAMVRYSTEGLDALIPLDETRRLILMAMWEAILDGMDRVKVAELGHYLDVCPVMPR